MNLIKDIETLNALLLRYFVKNTITNNYVLVDSYMEYVFDEKLFYESKASNTCILVDKGGFYRLYYFINDLNEEITIDTDKPIVMEILYRGESKRPDEVFSFWEKCGFVPHLTRDNMIAAYSQLVLPSTKASQVEIRYAESEAEIVFTKELIENALDKYTGDILTYDEITLLVEKRNVICAYWEGSLCGVLQFEIKNNVVWLGHIAVAAGFRGKGVANELVKAYIVNNAAQPSTRYQLWVIQNNIGAMALYQKFGFIYGNKSSASMLKM
jgi:GNAT superfamily N-acetyltransferase